MAWSPAKCPFVRPFVPDLSPPHWPHPHPWWEAFRRIFGPSRFVGHTEPHVVSCLGLPVCGGSCRRLYVFMHTNITLPTVEPPDRSIPNIRHWGGRDLKKFRARFTRWMRELSPDLPLHEQSSRILNEIQQYVTLRQKPLPREDPILLRLQSKLRASPRAPDALKQWGAHIHQKRHNDVLRRLRRFR